LTAIGQPFNGSAARKRAKKRRTTPTSAAAQRTVSTPASSTPKQLARRVRSTQLHGSLQPPLNVQQIA
jgi:hypothetical protein